MFWAFLSRRLRTWALFAVLLPLAGRVLEVVGRRVARRSPQAGRAITTAAGHARRPSRQVRRRYR